MPILGRWTGARAAVGVAGAVTNCPAALRLGSRSSSPMTLVNLPATSPRGDVRNGGDVAGAFSNGDSSGGSASSRVVSVPLVITLLVAVALLGATLAFPGSTTVHPATPPVPLVLAAPSAVGRHRRRTRSRRDPRRPDRHDHRACAAARVARRRAARMYLHRSAGASSRAKPRATASRSTSSEPRRSTPNSPRLATGGSPVVQVLTDQGSAITSGVFARGPDRRGGSRRRRDRGDHRRLPAHHVARWRARRTQAARTCWGVTTP